MSEKRADSLWVRLVEAMRSGDQEEAERLAAEVEQVRDEEVNDAE